jgi:cyclase
MTPEAAEDFKTASELLTGHKVKYVVKSHFHNDHIGGNQVTNKAGIISTQRTRELIAKFQPEEIADDKTQAPPKLEKIKNKNTSGMTPHELDENIMWTGYFEALITSNDSLKTVLPNITFKDQQILHETKRTVQLLSYGEGHTESDLFLYLPEEQIAFMGDLLFVQNQPWLGDGDPVKWERFDKRFKKISTKHDIKLDNSIFLLQT